MYTERVYVAKVICPFQLHCKTWCIKYTVLIKSAGAHMRLFVPHIF